MARRRQIYEGKAKILYEGPENVSMLKYLMYESRVLKAEYGVNI